MDLRNILAVSIFNEQGTTRVGRKMFGQTGAREAGTGKEAKPTPFSGDKTKEAIKKGTEKAKEGAKKAGEKAGEGAKKAGEKAQESGADLSKMF